jgi:hypothetical protein
VSYLGIAVAAEPAICGIFLHLSLL